LDFRGKCSLEDSTSNRAQWASRYLCAVNYLQDLNDAQRAAVTHVEGPMMVIAGAGSGKTRVLTFRIAHLLELGVDPFSILSLTFTNKAAKEMKDRIGKLVNPEEAKNIRMGTFHSVFAGILRAESQRLNYPSNFTIYDTTDSKSLIKTVIKEMNLDDKIYRPGMVMSRISEAKNKLFSPSAYLGNPDIMSDDASSNTPQIGAIYKRYNDRLFRSGAMDFDDLLFNTNVLLANHPDMLFKYQNVFQFVLVDEYQDTNYSQYMIIKQLAGRHENICVVGDDAQSIYAFRGADIGNILNFKRDYPGFTLYKLEQNYRSTKTIVRASNGIIERNKNRIEKVVWTDNSQGNKIFLNRSLTDNNEGHFVAQSIHELVSSRKAAYSDCAVLYRTNAQTRAFEEAFRKINIPYKVYAGMSFYQRKEIKDLLAYFRLSANPNDEESFKRILNYPLRGLGKTSLDNIMISAFEHGVSLWDVAISPGRFGCKISASAKQRLEEFTTKIRSFTAEMDSADAHQLANRIAFESGIMSELRQMKEPEDLGRMENIESLLAGIQEFSQNSHLDGTNKTLSDFLVEVALLTDADNDDKDEDSVKMMTIHAAKGLEFDHVFLVGLEENLFPAMQSMDSRESLEEERRLFYVAVTRARLQLYLSYALSRFRFGQLTHNDPSRFIEEIEPDCLHKSPDLKKNEPFDRAPIRTSAPRLNLTPVQKAVSTSNPQNVSGKLSEGMEVLHDRFGKGKVLKVEGKPGEEKATVFFPKEGEKQLLLKFARLEIIN
jgi:DNA helicase II / ATP-dependent DNA helicase PcrA